MMLRTDADLAPHVREALRQVIDPELGQNVVDLGMIYDVQVTDGCVATIRMTTTTRGCPAAGFIRQAVEDRAWSVEGIEFVDVQLTYDPPWSPALIAPEIAGFSATETGQAPRSRRRRTRAGLYSST